jgi:hypothetical protein
LSASPDNESAVEAVRVPVKAVRVLAKAISVLVKALRVPVKAVRVLVTRVFTKVTFGISRKLKFYTKMVLFSRNFKQFRIFLYYFLYDISYNLA